jgi:hypothetical protein
MVLDEDSTPPPPSGSCNVVMTLAPEPTPAAVATDSLLDAEVLEPSPVAEVPGPSRPRRWRSLPRPGTPLPSRK